MDVLTYALAKKKIKEEIDSALTSAMTYKGAVATLDNLPKSGNKNGDLYDVTDLGQSYAWDGAKWNKHRDIDSKLIAGDGIQIENDIISGTKVDVSKGSTNIIEVEGYNSSKLGFEFSQDDVVLAASSPMLFGERRTLQEKLTAGDGIEIDNNTISVVGGGNEVFVAVYGRTSYADVKDAIDANKIIILDMYANHNQFCVTYSTYTNGGDALMYAIFKMNNRATLMTATLTPADHWTVSHTDLQEKLESGINIKTVNNQSILGAGNVDITVDSAVFIAKYGVTPYADVRNAIDNNQVIVVNQGTGSVICNTTINNDGKSNESITLYCAARMTSSTNVLNVIYNISKSLDTWNVINSQLYIDNKILDSTTSPVQGNIIKNYVDVADAILQAQLGTLADLATTEKLNLVDAINEVNGKNGMVLTRTRIM